MAIDSSLGDVHCWLLMSLMNLKHCYISQHFSYDNIMRKGYSWDNRYAHTKVKFKPSIATCTLTSSNASHVLTIFWQMYLYRLIVGQIIQLSYLSISLFLCYDPPGPVILAPPGPPKTMAPSAPPVAPRFFKVGGPWPPRPPPWRGPWTGLLL